MRTNHGKDLKCLILCAGLGTRLRPLTESLPKPLATVWNVPLFDIALRACALSGASEIAINTHHLHELMAQHAQKSAKNLGLKKLHISHEYPIILGTGGALCKLASWWGESNLLVYNGDVLSDIDLQKLADEHMKSSNLVTLAIRDEPPGDGGRSVWLDHRGNIKYIAKRADLPPEARNLVLREAGFACAYVASPELRQYLPSDPQFFDVIEAFNLAITDNRALGGVIVAGLWADIGTPKALWETNLRVAEMNEASRGRLLGPGSQTRIVLPKNCRIDSKTVIASSVTIGSNAEISNSVLLEGAIVQPGERLQGCLRGLGFDETFAELS